MLSQLKCIDYIFLKVEQKNQIIALLSRKYSQFILWWDLFISKFNINDSSYTKMHLFILYMFRNPDPDWIQFTDVRNSDPERIHWGSFLVGFGGSDFRIKSDQRIRGGSGSDPFPDPENDQDWSDLIRKSDPPNPTKKDPQWIRPGSEFRTSAPSGNGSDPDPPRILCPVGVIIVLK